ncbi:MAG: rRNA maturation RNase YbeY [Ilumatobacter sp.]|uniref:rRNA maturation RNase YbeY n=1 Tax=Ilumatobacter sp. TaxID=1967498 RepID=UPI003C74F930
MSDCPVVVSDVRSGDVRAALPVELGRWSLLAAAAAEAEGGVGELTLTFVDAAEIAELNAEYMGQTGPTDVLSFPMDDEAMPGVPTLLGDIVVCPEVAEAQFAEHAGTFDDEIALLVVHGVLHVLGHDHAEDAEATLMREREVTLLRAFHWRSDPPIGFRQTHD